MLQPVLVLGGRSDIGLAAAARFAAAGHPIQLAARNVASLEANQKDIALRYNVPLSLHEFDATDLGSHAAFVDGLDALPEVAISVVGLLGDAERSRHDQEHAASILRSNFEGPATLLALLADRFEARGSGVIVGVSSVAGDRGRQSNYIYGSAKAGFTAFLAGLRNRLSKTGVHVVTVKPGFVATKMTEGMKLPPALTATPEAVAESIFKAVAKKQDIIYVKPIWFIIMTIIRFVPERIFKRLSM